jgi:GAF domain-containing protein
VKLVQDLPEVEQDIQTGSQPPLPDAGQLASDASQPLPDASPSASDATPALPQASPPSPDAIPPPKEPLPSPGPAAPAAWERFQGDLGEATRLSNEQEVSAMNNVLTELMRGGMDADKVFELVVVSAATLTGATGSALALAEGGKFVCRARYGASAPPLGTRLDPSSGLSGLCVRTGHLLRCDDAEHDPRVNRALTRETGIRSISVVPLIKDGKLVGIFEILSTRSHAFDKKESETLQRMSKLVVLTMSRMGELRGKAIEGSARARWWRVLSLMALAFLIGFAASRLLGPLLFGH